MYTISRPPEELKKVVEAFYQGGGEGKPIVSQGATLLRPQ